MKGLKMKEGKHLGMVFCFLLACFLFSVDVSAQYYPPLVAPLQAQTILNNQLPVLENNISIFLPGTSERELAERKLGMYMHAWEQLTAGDAVEDALTAAYGEFAQDANGYHKDLDEFLQLDKAVVNYGDQAFDDLVNLLKK